MKQETKKVTIFVGSAHKGGATYRSACRFREDLEFVGGALGFNVVKGSCIRTLEPMDENAADRMERTLAQQSRRFHARLWQPAHPAPSLDYYYPTQLGPFKKAAGAVFDWTASRCQ